MLPTPVNRTSTPPRPVFMPADFFHHDPNRAIGVGLRSSNGRFETENGKVFSPH